MRTPLALALMLGTITQAAAESQNERWNRAREPFRLAGNTWYVGTEGLSVLLIRGEQGAVLIDGGLPETAARVAASLAQLQVDPHEIKLILSSHAHADHAGGIAALKALTGARVLASAESAKQMAAGGKGDLHFGDDLTYPAVTVDDTLVDGETIALGELRLTAHFTPGHTPGSTSWSWSERDGEREVVVVYADSLTAPGYQLVGHPRRPQLVDEFRKTFVQVAALRCDLLITPHPDASELFARAAAKSGAQLIDAGGCKRYAGRARANFDDELAKQTRARAESPTP
jgi:metallo-beta-lactamase class B